MKKIKVGYEVGTGTEIFVTPNHMVITGLTQLAGKTTALEAFIERSGRKSVVFKTKIGEKSFLKGTIIPPFFVDRSDWQFVKGLIESTLGQKLNTFDQSRIIQICDKTGGHSLIEFKKEVDRLLTVLKPGSVAFDMTINLRAYLDIVLPKLQSIKFSTTLELIEGLNIIDLERFSRDPEVQSLVISSVADEVLNKFKDVILLIPESWKFLPQDTNNPCKRAVEEYIRQGSTNNNFIWIDSQDIAAIDKKFLKSVSTWFLGYQSEINEVKHTLQQIPLPASSKPKANDIQTLGTGEFYLAERERVVKVYVQPAWLDDERARKVAMGEMKVSEIDVPQSLSQFSIPVKRDDISQQEKVDLTELSKRFSKQMNEMREDFFLKVGDLQEQLTELNTQIYYLKNAPKQEIDEDAIVGIVLQKMPTPKVTAPVIAAGAPLDEEALIKKILSRVPAGGDKVYQVAPLEMIKKEFIQEAKEKIIMEIDSVSEKAKKVLKYAESRGVELSAAEIAMKALYLPNGNGGNGTSTNNFIKELMDIEVMAKVNSRNRGVLRKRIDFFLSTHEASDEEKENLYNHIIAEILK